MTSIPQEIIDLIAPHLNQHDLADCSRVCHDWSSLFSPGLWRSINIANQSTHDRFNTPESRAALIRNKHLVREVTATDQDLLLLLAAHDHSEPSLPKLTGLRSLTLCFYADAPWALTMGTTPQEDENEGEDEVTVTATEALVAMTVRLARVDNFRALLELLSNNTNLRNLRLKKGCLRGADRTELLLHIMEACATTSLTTLESLGGLRAGSGIYWRLGDGTGSLLRTVCPCLTDLALYGVIVLSDSCLAALLRSSQPGWKILELGDLAFFQNEAYLALMECVSTTLEELRIRNWRGFSPERCSGFLSASTRGQFRRLEGLSTETWTIPYKSLQLTLRMRTGSIVLKGQGGGCRVKIYSQLASMSGLQELILGRRDLNWSRMNSRGLNASMSSIEIEEALTSYDFDTYQYDCLEFSLESGLGILAGLKELRVLDEKSTAHRIGIAELEWMRMNWPKLKTIEGLLSRREWAGTLEDGQAVRDAVEDWIDNHPNGIGPSFAL
ncbi:MAG: hypothetical protein JOS17DRAFT_796703 [Linnemannia elongata]|nr:MAG: hypothetical protein JOS17DRAFT_796703 [Linnemannia elongata]